MATRRGRSNARKILGTILAAALLSACATPTQSIFRRAQAFGFDVVELPGRDFRHTLFVRGHGASLAWHVYVEGDGRPWATRHRVSEDPTPRQPRALEMMAKDPHPSIYLGRPCYFAQVEDPACSPLLWTHARYAPRVVHSMAAALKRFLEVKPASDLVFIGYSGGGTLAWLLAREIPEKTRAVVTVAGNLDIEAWTRRHGYSPLRGSLNPASEAPLDRSIRQVHLVGADDANVPPDMVQRLIRNNPGARRVVVAGFDHRCCWAERWPALLDRALAGQ